MAALDDLDQFSADEHWNAGELGCGELVIALRRRLKALQPGQRLHLVARDPAAPLDIAAWCRLTGHRLRITQHPDYLIQRKDD